MKLGLIARADNTGLGMQTWEFYLHMNPTKTMVVDISRYNGYKQYPERYMGNDDATFIYGFPAPYELRAFLEGLDCVFIAESAYNPKLFNIAREMGVKTAVQYNYEFMDWLVNPDFPKPDMLVAPSTWHYAEVDAWCNNNGVKHVLLHCPVNRDKLPKREITQARTFLHMAGRSAAYDRNGTKTVIEASRYLKTDAHIVIHFQGEQGLPHQATMSIGDYQSFLQTHGDPSKVDIVTQELVEYQDIYAMGDVLLLPRRYGGNCLPLSEALSIGMPVVMTGISPNSESLPPHWLIRAWQIGQFTPRTAIDIYGGDPVELAARIDWFYNLDETLMRAENNTADALADRLSWPNMKDKYIEAFEALCSQ